MNLFLLKIFTVLTLLTVGLSAGATQASLVISKKDIGKDIIVVLKDGNSKTGKLTAVDLKKIQISDSQNSQTIMNSVIQEVNVKPSWSHNSSQEKFNIFGFTFPKIFRGGGTR
ncbi:MAG: hypothetical protein HC836_35710 [Richelia sp. RM2_1_2]|nr:hypothetical protein [Richelia sp. RM1_1_1]NJO63373.1 hypothetical protein [Richelia sp. RM2_1_2]